MLVLALPAALLLVLPAAPARAQSSEVHDRDAPLVPRGRLRLDLVPTFASWNSRFGLRREDGRTVEEEEPLGLDLTDPAGTRMFPGIRTLEDDLRALIDDPSYRSRLGATRARVGQDVTRVDLGARLGVFDWLTLGVTLPVVRTLTDIDVHFAPDTIDGDLGLNPAMSQADAVARFLQELVTRAADAQNLAAEVCAADASSRGCADAQSASQGVTEFLDRIQGALFASPFFPLAGSPVGLALSGSLAALSQALQRVGLQGIDAPLPFASARPTADDFVNLPANPLSGIAGAPLRSMEGLWQMGDLEMFATVRLLRGEIRDSAEAPPKASYLLAGGFLVRSGTGKTDDPDIFLDLGTGDGQTDYEGRLFAIATWKSRIRLAATARYGAQSARAIVRRVTPPDAILAPASSRRVLEWTPGSYRSVEVSPQYRLTPELSFTGAYSYFRKDRDRYTLRADASGDLPAVDVSVLELETARTLHEIEAGLRYSTVSAWRQGRAGSPMELSFAVRKAIHGAGGRTPKATRIVLGLRIFKRIFGADPRRAAPATPASASPPPLPR